MAQMTMLYLRTIQTYNDYVDCVIILQWWSICYYQCCYDTVGMPEVPDSVNDYLYRMVEAWEEANPDKINQYSPTQQVGFGEMIDDAKKADIKQAYISIQEGLKRLYA
jgi:NAD-dependent DNA ligase